MKPRTWSLVAFASIAIWALVLAGACGSAAPEADRGHQHDHHEGEMVSPGVGGAELLEPISLGAGQRLKVVATTNIVGDVVGQVGGDHIELTTLMSVGVDPHSYVPTPADTAAIHDAHVVFANGAGLEADLEEMFEGAGGEAVHVHVSHGLEHREVSSDRDEAEQGLDHDNGAVDPHVWFDVQNVIHWVDTIEHTLGALDPSNAEFYEANAQRYVRDLEELDAWVVEQVATIPEANRKLVTSHPVFGYLSERYGLEQLGAVYPISPSSEPSARDIAVLEDAILEYSVPAVFAESTVNPKLAEQVANDTGVKLVALYTGSLGEPGSGAESYVLLMRYDVSAIVDALK
jgi:ABC-type Zn uptake system ZnuABC Zn-binding protein ZnuA